MIAWTDIAVVYGESGLLCRFLTPTAKSKNRQRMLPEYGVLNQNVVPPLGSESTTKICRRVIEYSAVHQVQIRS
jgi:hypothetical protein